MTENIKIFKLRIYSENNVWVFDDLARGLVKKPLTNGVEAIIDIIASWTEAIHSFDLYFCDEAFNGAMWSITLQKKSLADNFGGGYYSLDSATSEVDCWISPDIYLYFQKLPPKIYIQVKFSLGDKRRFNVTSKYSDGIELLIDKKTIAESILLAMSHTYPHKPPYTARAIEKFKKEFGGDFRGSDIKPITKEPKALWANNAQYALYIYKDEGEWVFDDTARTLEKEPFIEGADDIIDFLLEQEHIGDAEKKGFLLFFSPKPFPTAHAKLSLSPERPPLNDGGYYYQLELGEVRIKAWLCPALNLFFENAPETLFVKLKESPGRQQNWTYATPYF